MNESTVVICDVVLIVASYLLGRADYRERVRKRMNGMLNRVKGNVNLTRVLTDVKHNLLS
jgi:hypothetical protein